MTQQLVRVQKTMGQESTPICMKAFRVVSHQGGLYHKWLVIEDTERAQFRFVGYSASWNRPTKAEKATIDKDDAWNALNSLRDAARVAERGSFYPVTADSIDGAIAQEQTEREHLHNRSSPEMPKTPTSRRNEPAAKRKGTKPLVRVRPDPMSSEAELRQMIDEVWDFAGGMDLKWKAGGQTPAGHEYEVLTFDGSERVLVRSTSVGIPCQ